MLNEQSIRAMAVLHDPVRRRLYQLVRGSGRPVSREEAAAETGISRGLAAFHLDKLVERGLLTFRYARPEGRSGPGAGRPSKLYEPSEQEVSASIPPRRYDMIGKLLVESILADPGNRSRPEVAEAVAAREGRSIGEEIRKELRLRPPGSERALATATDILRDRGYEPYPADEGGLRLRNCPFHDLARHAPELICRMNRAFIEGVVRGLGNESLAAALEPTPGECCVVLRPRDAVAERG